MKYQQYVRQAILEGFAGLQKDEQDRLIEIFSKNLRQTLYAKLYEAKGLSNVLVEDQWIKSKCQIGVGE